jgi:hypothetical protein
LQTTLSVDPAARHISAVVPCLRVRVNAAQLPGSIFSIASCNSQVNCPTPHCICGPALRNNARYEGSKFIVQRDACA